MFSNDCDLVMLPPIREINYCPCLLVTHINVESINLYIYLISGIFIECLDPILIQMKKRKIVKNKSIIYHLKLSLREKNSFICSFVLNFYKNF